MMKVEQQNEPTPLNLVYGNSHFEPIDIYYQITNIESSHSHDAKRII
jgi:hypothetical protein